MLTPDELAKLGIKRWGTAGNGGEYYCFVGEKTNEDEDYPSSSGYLFGLWPDGTCDVSQYGTTIAYRPKTLADAVAFALHELKG
jgi:hypothetical protein